MFNYEFRTFKLKDIFLPVNFIQKLNSEKFLNRVFFNTFSPYSNQKEGSNLVILFN